MGHLYHGYVSHNQKVGGLVINDSHVRSRVKTTRYQVLSFQASYWADMTWADMTQITLWLWLTVRHGIDGPNRNRWFT